MKIVLDVKNNKVFKPSTNDVIIYDGHKWYVTTKDDILKEANDLLLSCKRELTLIKAENKAMKEDTAAQLLQMSALIKSLLSK